MTPGEDPRDDEPAADSGMGSGKGSGKGAGPTSDAEFDAAWMDIVSHFHDSGTPAPAWSQDWDTTDDELVADTDPDPLDPTSFDPTTWASDAVPQLEAETASTDAAAEPATEAVADSASDVVPDLAPDEPALRPLPQLPPERPEIDLDDPRLHRVDPLPAWTPAEAPDESVFVPPTPPPLPPTTPQRRAAWLTVFGAPAALLLLVLLPFTPPRVLTYALVAGFLGAFGYLVATMSNTPRDPWDDGSRV